MPNLQTIQGTPTAADTTNETESRMSVTSVEQLDNDNLRTYQTHCCIQQEKDHQHLLYSHERK